MILKKIPNLAKQIIHAEETHDSDYVMTCNYIFPPYQTTLRSCCYIHYFYIKTKYNDKEEIINNIFSTSVEPFLNDIKHTALLQERKLNLDAAAYEKKIYANVFKPSVKK